MSAAPVILDYINEEDIDLLVMGTHGRRGLGHIALGSVAEELVRVHLALSSLFASLKRHGR